MRHNTERGIAYSVVPLGTSLQLFLTGEPEENYLYHGDEQGHGVTVADYPRQIRNLFENIVAVCKKEGFDKNAAMMCQFFLADTTKSELVRQIASEVFPQQPGAVTFAAQPPASGKVIAVEIWAVAERFPQQHQVNVKTPLPGQVTIVEFDGWRWFFGGGFRSEPSPVGAYARSLSAFEQLGKQLKANKFNLDETVRTWIYQGHLVLSEGDTQRYKELNRARTDYFGNTKFLKRYLPKDYRGDVYPASTGIGTDDMDVVIGAVAIDTKRKDVIAVPLENPNQTSAFDYGVSYSPQSPKFARAMAVAAPAGSLIFVSGTASITNSESRYLEDPVKQTEQTLDNIEALISGSNLESHGISGFQSGLENLECVRVYIKRIADLENVRKVCEKRLKDVPAVYTIADVCRPELLVEIEGFAIVTKQSDAL
ncbi:PTS cellobiose transporter subunit IIC [Planctomycetales bacterium]|nr:PTS cellobiose transporter subunit IIC [Planctomycetales bacterium]